MERKVSANVVSANAARVKAGMRVIVVISKAISMVKNLQLVETKQLWFKAVDFMAMFHNVLDNTQLLTLKMSEIIALMKGADVDIELVDSEDGSYSNPIITGIRLNAKMKQYLSDAIQMQYLNSKQRAELGATRAKEALDSLFVDTSAPAEAPAAEEAPVVELTRWQKAALTRARNRAAAAAAASE